MIKGGYKIINFGGTALSGTAVDIDGIYERITGNNYGKALLITGVVLGGDLMNEVFSTFTVDESDNIIINAYDGVITVNDDDEVTFTAAGEGGDTDSGYQTLITGVKYRKIGNILEILFTGNGTVNVSKSSWGTLATLPEGFRPTEVHYDIAVIGDSANAYCELKVGTDGKIEAIQQSNGPTTAAIWHTMMLML